MTSDDLQPEGYVPPKIPDARPGPEGGKRHLNRLAKTRALCEAALSCFLVRGLDAVTIDDIVGTAGVSKGSFYRYFDNKETLVATLFQPIASSVGDAMTRCCDALEQASDEASLQGAYAVFANELMGVLAEHADAVRLFLQERHGPRSPDRVPILDLDHTMVTLAIRMTHAGRANGLLREVDARVSALMVLGAVHELLWRQFHGEGPADPVAGAAALIDIVLHGVRAS